MGTDESNFVQGFATQLRRYLSCPGHPDSPEGRLLVDDNVFERDANDLTLRARFLLGAVYDEERLPVNPGWSISVGSGSLILHRKELTHSQFKFYTVTVRAQSENASGFLVTLSLGSHRTQIALGIHACLEMIDVPIAPHLMRLVHESAGVAADDHRGTPFDVWVHSQFKDAQGYFNGDWYMSFGEPTIEHMWPP
jgi:hypothetical protein